MDPNKEPQLLAWIAEEYEERLSNSKSGTVPAKLLQIKFAMSVTENNDFDMTKSMEHSLSLFGKSDLSRLLRQLNKQFLIEFTDSDGERVNFGVNDLESFRKQLDKGVLHVRPTALGLSKVQTVIIEEGEDFDEYED